MWTGSECGQGGSWTEAEFGSKQPLTHVNRRKSKTQGGTYRVPHLDPGLERWGHDYATSGLQHWDGPLHALGVPGLPRGPPQGHRATDTLRPWAFVPAAAWWNSVQSMGWGTLSLVLTPGADQMENSECGVELICVFLLRKDVLCAQSCLTLCNPMDCSPPGSSVQGTLQARVLECVAISFSEKR